MNEIDNLLEVMEQLRDPQNGCPWDRGQDFRSIAPCTIEEAYEVADAIDQGDMGQLREELGDLLFQVVFHARMAEELGAFDFRSVAAGISDKLVRRHPHVFGGTQSPAAGSQRQDWEGIKAQERGTRAALDGVAKALPALARATKLGRRAAAVGFDWPDMAGVVDKIHEELAEVQAAMAADPAALAEEIGDLLFAVTNLARHAQVDAEEALRLANAKFERRFAHVERRVGEGGRPWAGLAPAELDRYWREAKRAG
ncbi:MAG: nucleoside triphosphate pyrophosphohydrolase [Gammaproteobacteria bacterium]|nr:nucleoside triphosphate pyrophosphohydrolase [Gammaproteobacteria bacterium]